MSSEGKSVLGGVKERVAVRVRRWVVSKWSEHKGLGMGGRISGD